MKLGGRSGEIPGLHLFTVVSVFLYSRAIVDNAVSAWENWQDLANGIHGLQPDFAAMADIEIEPLPLIEQIVSELQQRVPQRVYWELNGVGLNLLPARNRHD